MYVRVCVRFLCMCACVGRVYLCVLVCNSKNDFRHSYCFFFFFKDFAKFNVFFNFFVL